MNLKQICSLFVLFVACATPNSGAPPEYRRGTYVSPVPPPTFSPTTAAPHTVGQPGYVNPGVNYPRGTDNRILPQTPETRREPGLWASDRPRASGDDNHDEEMLPPFPPLPDAPTQRETWADGLCRSQVSTIINVMLGERSRKWYESFPKIERNCISSRLYVQCIGHLKSILSPDDSRSLERLFSGSSAFVKPRCSKVDLSSEMDKLLLDAMVGLRDGYIKYYGEKP